MDQGNEARSPKSSLFIGEEVSESESPADLKASSRDFARQEPRRGRKLRTVVGAAAVLGGGWVMGLNSQFNMAQSRVWFDEGAIKVSSAVASVQRGVLDRREHLTRAIPATPQFGEEIDSFIPDLPQGAN